MIDVITNQCNSDPMYMLSHLMGYIVSNDDMDSSTKTADPMLEIYTDPFWSVLIGRKSQCNCFAKPRSHAFFFLFTNLRIFSCSKAFSQEKKRDNNHEH